MREPSFSFPAFSLCRCRLPSLACFNPCCVRAAIGSAIAQQSHRVVERRPRGEKRGLGQSLARLAHPRLALSSAQSFSALAAVVRVAAAPVSFFRRLRGGTGGFALAAGFSAIASLAKQTANEPARGRGGALWSRPRGSAGGQRQRAEYEDQRQSQRGYEAKTEREREREGGVKKGNTTRRNNADPLTAAAIFLTRATGRLPAEKC